jgi:hypothetical protein
MIALTITSISECEKTNTNDYKKFLGTWISKDSVDTIEFTSDQDIYKMISGFNDHFLYSFTIDSITIEYRRKEIPYIYMGSPTPAFYQLKGNILTMDFIRHLTDSGNKKLNF